MDYEFLFEGNSHRISLENKGGRVVAVLDGRALELDIQRTTPHTVSLLLNGKSYLAHMARHGDKIFVSVGASQFCLVEPGQESSLPHLTQGAPEKAEGTIKAPMPGMVIKVNVAEGSAVNPGDSLVVVEAMKMEHEMRAAFPAMVEKIHVKAGQQVDAFQPLVELSFRDVDP